jgi:hypothetical protein
LPGLRQNQGDRCRGRGLPVVYVTDGPNVYVRFRPLKLLFCQNTLPLYLSTSMF